MLQEAHHSPSTAVAITNAMDANPTNELAALSELSDYRVSADNTDPRGWPIVDSNAVPIGTATDLIIDLQALSARYIVCSVSRDTTRMVLIPTGFARLDTDTSTVHLDFLTVADIANLPAHTGLPLSEVFSATMESVLTGAAPADGGTAKIVRRTS
jgi:hypothetical protein